MDADYAELLMLLAIGSVVFIVYIAVAEIKYRIRRGRRK